MDCSDPDAAEVTSSTVSYSAPRLSTEAVTADGRSLLTFAP